MSVRRAPLLRRLCFFSLLAACGSRTGLFIDDTPGPLPDDGGGIGVGTKDGGKDGLPTEDVVPPIDVQPPPDVFKNDCPDADATLVYVITEQYELFSFFPPDGSFKKIGNIACPSPS